jgi:hypothetical protein
MKSRLMAVAIHKRAICGNDRFAPILQQKSATAGGRSATPPISVNVDPTDTTHSDCQAGLKDPRSIRKARDSKSATWMRPESASPQRYPICRLRPCAQPMLSSASRKTAVERCQPASDCAKAINTPARRGRSSCCARTANGAPAAAPPTNPRKFRRLMSAHKKFCNDISRKPTFAAAACNSDGVTSAHPKSAFVASAL